MTRGRADGWRAPILSHFSDESALAGRLTVVSDPDGLLTEPGVVARIGERGFEFISFEDHVAFRFAYESRYRRHWDRGDSTHLVVVIRTERGDFQAIPHDLLEEARAAGRALSFSLVELFPNLAPKVVGELEHREFDALADAVERMGPGNLGENATWDFILRHVFEIAPELIKTPSDLLRVLLRKHYRSRVFPEQFDTRFIEVLTQSKTWQDWPLERIVPSKEAFLSFLVSRWPHFLVSKGFEIAPGREPAAPSIPGPIDIPFDHDDVRVYIDNLFAEGLLEPTAAIEPSSVAGTWYRIGVVGDPVEDARVRIDRLLETLGEELPGPEDDPVVWSGFAWQWAEVVHLRWKMEAAAPAELLEKLTKLHDRIEESFAEWMLKGYGAIHTLSHLPRPTTLHKIAPYLAYHRSQTETKENIALIVVDGLALDQWLILRESLDELRLEESAAFAWVPTLTAVSRQSIFAGEPPYHYGQHLGTTHKEPSHWARFWDNEGLRGPAVDYIRQSKNDNADSFLARIRESAEHPQRKVLGIVISTVDQMIHGTITGTGGMHASVRHWAQQGHFLTVVQTLLDRDYEVFITADHGNIEGVGMGKPNVGAIADERGERVHVFTDDATRANVQAAFTGSIIWPQLGLPDDYRPLMPPGRAAFLAKGTRSVGHGGISLEEVVVPFIRISEAE